MEEQDQERIDNQERHEKINENEYGKQMNVIGGRREIQQAKKCSEGKWLGVKQEDYQGSSKDEDEN